MFLPTALKFYRLGNCRDADIKAYRSQETRVRFLQDFWDLSQENDTSDINRFLVLPSGGSVVPLLAAAAGAWLPRAGQRPAGMGDLVRVASVRGC